MSLPKKSPITTHLLNTSTGKPASNINVSLYFLDEKTWTLLGKGVSNADGRVSDLLPTDHVLKKGQYKINFDVSTVSTFYPEASITFNIANTNEHYHIPLLISGYGFSTYRGS